MNSYLVMEERDEFEDVDLDAVAQCIVKACSHEDAIREAGIYGRIRVYEMTSPQRFNVTLTPTIEPLPRPRITTPDRPRNVNDSKLTVELPDLTKK